jgi:hypothetical protein
MRPRSVLDLKHGDSSMKTSRQTTYGAIALIVSGMALLGCGKSSKDGGPCDYWNGTWIGNEIDSYGTDLGPASMAIGAPVVDLTVSRYASDSEVIIMNASCNADVVPHQITATITGGNHPEAVGAPVRGIYELDTTTMSGRVAVHKPGMTSYPTSFLAQSGQRLFVFSKTGVAPGGTGGVGNTGRGGSSGSGGTGGKGGSGGATGGTGGLACNGPALPADPGILSISDGYVTTGDLQGYGFTWAASSPASTCITPACTNSGCTPMISGTAVCAAGTVAADSTYASCAGWGFNFDQPADSSSGLTVPAPAAITVSYTNPGRTPLRLQLTSDTTSNPTTWCRVLVSDSGSTVIASGSTIQIAEFNTKCWDGSGMALTAGTGIAGIALVVPSKSSVATPFAGCLTGVQFAGTSSDDGGPPMTDAPGTGGLAGSTGTGGIGGTGGTGGINLDAPSATGGAVDAGGEDAAVTGSDSAESMGGASGEAGGGSVTSGLVEHWVFQGSAEDATGNGHHGAVYGGVTPTADRLGNEGGAYQFDGSDGYIDVPDSPDFHTAAVTVAVWARDDSMTGSKAGGCIGEYIVFKRNSRSSNFEGHKISFDGAGPPLSANVTVASSSGAQVNTGADLPAMGT